MINVYFDVDGVFNAYSNSPPAAETGWAGDWLPMRIPGSYPGQCSLELVAAVNQLALTPGVTCKWLTSWEEQAAVQLAPVLGLNAGGWEVITGVEDDAFWDWWKLDRIKKDVAASSPDRFIWIDDDIDFDPPAGKWLAHVGDQGLPICPKTIHGLTHQHLEQISSFLEEWAPRLHSSVGRALDF